MEHFVAQSHIFPVFMAKESSLPYFLLETGYQDYSYWTKQLQTLSKVWIPFSVPPLTHLIWIHHLRNQMSLHLQSIQGWYTWLVLFQILLNLSLLLARNLINCGARLEYYLCLYHWQARCQHLSWFNIFPVIQQQFGSSILFHQTISLWSLLIKRLIRVFLTFSLGSSLVLCAFMGALTGFCWRLRNTLSLACPTLLTSVRGSRNIPGASFHFNGC